MKLLILNDFINATILKCYNATIGNA